MFNEVLWQRQESQVSASPVKKAVFAREKKWKYIFRLEIRRGDLILEIFLFVYPKTIDSVT